MDIGLQIKKFREQQKISQEELALKIFVSRQTISNWETNKSCPDVKSLITLSNIFNVSLDNFIKEDIKEIEDKVEALLKNKTYKVKLDVDSESIKKLKEAFKGHGVDASIITRSISANI